MAAWDWIRRVQIAAALVIAHLDGDTPWGRSSRRALLLSLAYGPMDWSGVAAIVALTELAVADREIERDVSDIFVDLLGLRPDQGEWALEGALLHGLARLPNLDDEAREAVRARLADL